MSFKSAHYRSPYGADSLRVFLIVLEFESIGSITDAMLLSYTFHLSTPEEI